MSGFVGIDLSRLPAPAVVEALSYEAILAERKAEFLARWDAVRINRPELPAFDTLGLESEPFVKLLEVAAYREFLLRARVNDGTRALMLAKAQSSDLDHVGAGFGVLRMLVTPATVGSPAVYESDERFRERIQLAPEAYSVAGPAGAYEFHALSLDARIIRAHAWSPRSGDVDVVLAGANGAPVPDAVMAATINLFAREDIVPLTDTVTVRHADVVTYDVTLLLQVQRGPDPTAIRAEAEARIRAYAAERYRIGSEVYRSGITAAAKVAGVENVTLQAPDADVVCDDSEIPHLGTITITVEVL